MFLTIIALFSILLNSAQAKTYAVVVGLDTFEGASTAVASAAYNCGRIGGESTDYHDVSSVALCAEEATKQPVLTALANAGREAKDGDVVIFIWLGHGYFDEENGRKGLAPYDWNPSDESTGLELERDIFPILRMSPAKFVILLDANHKASHRWDESQDKKRYLVLHGPTAADFVEFSGKAYVISATDAETFAEPSDSMFGNAVVVALKADESGVLTLQSLHRKIVSLMNGSGRTVGLMGTWEIGFDLAHSEVENKPKREGDWRRPALYASVGVSVAGATVWGEEWSRTRSLHLRLVNYDYTSLKGDDGYYDIAERRDSAYRNAKVGAVVTTVAVVTSGTLIVLERRDGRQPTVTALVSARGFTLFGRF